MANKDFEVKQILPVVVAVAATFVLTFVAGEARATGCASADRVSLPSCLEAERYSGWKTIGITNNCGSTKEAHVKITKGDDVTLTAESNRYNQYTIPSYISAYGARIGSPTKCCTTTYNCDDD